MKMGRRIVKPGWVKGMVATSRSAWYPGGGTASPKMRITGKISGFFPGSSFNNDDKLVSLDDIGGSWFMTNASDLRVPSQKEMAKYKGKLLAFIMRSDAGMANEG